MQILKGRLLYFALAFGADFVLGTVRVLWLVPRLGTRAAELMEAPIMLVVTILAARWVAALRALPAAFATRIAVGCLALGLLLVAEFTLSFGFAA